uniref:Uncharacterized protein n=1 Tax=Arundo donax TaxID=35708 RepID=A0A0A8YD85_ARUDO
MLVLVRQLVSTWAGSSMLFRSSTDITMQSV